MVQDDFIIFCATVNTYIDIYSPSFVWLWITTWKVCKTDCCIVKMLSILPKFTRKFFHF